MRILFDTSILVASLIEKHDMHEASISWLKKARHRELKMIISSHSLLECYAVLTRLPLTPRITPALARQLIVENFSDLAEIVCLPPDEYFSLIQDCVNQSLCGGIVYDALIRKIATMAQAKHLLTLNGKDFIRLSLANKEFVITP